MNSFSSTRVNDLKSADAWPSGGALVVTATFNERDNIDLLIEKVLATDPTIQLLVIDDDSPDQTGIHAMLLATQNARLHVLVRRGRRGLGSAIEEGFREASRRGFWLLSILMAISATTLPTFRDCLLHSASLLQSTLSSDLGDCPTVV